MRRNFYIFLTILFSFALLVACEKSTENKDSNSPHVSGISLNRPDTIPYFERDTTNLGIEHLIDTFFVNLHENEPLIDTLVFGRPVIYSVRLEDEEALSAYRLRVDTVPNNYGQRGDTAYSLNIRGDHNIFKEREVELKDVRTNASFTDSLKYTGRIDKDGNPTEGGKRVSYNKPVRQGNYYLRVWCTDTNGNQDSVNHPIVVLSMDSLIKIRGYRK